MPADHHSLQAPGAGAALWRTLRENSKVQDCVFLAAIVLLSMAPYIGDIGFYGDDWSFQSIYGNAEDQSLWGQFIAHYDDWNRMRPGQIFYQASLHWLFGLEPIGYHLANGIVFVLSIALLYLVLRELEQPRALALGISVLYSVLPQYSADRFWPAASQIMLSMGFCFLSLYADLRTIRSRNWLKLWVWKLLSLGGMAASLLSYELTFPFFFLSPLVVFYLYRRSGAAADPERIGHAAFVLSAQSHYMALAALAAFKAITTVRMSSYETVDQTIWFVRFIEEAFSVGYGYYGFYLPYTAVLHSLEHLSVAGLAFGVVTAALIFSYFQRLKFSLDEMRPILFAACIVAGVAIFVLGYGIFVSNRNVSVGVTAGLGNRIALASTVGVAMSLMAGFAWLSRVPRTQRARSICFSGLVALFCGAGLLTNNSLASLWIDSYEKQQAVLDDLRERFPGMPSGTTFILDGVCPYSGPAVVFESDWDLRGALQIMHGDKTILADVVGPYMRSTVDGLTTSMYGYETFYPYGENMIVYDFERKTTHRLSDREAACEYFGTISRGPAGCPRGMPGYGTPFLGVEGSGLHGSGPISARYSLRSLPGGGEEIIPPAGGKAIKVAPRSMEGWVDQFSRYAGSVRIVGWSAEADFSRSASEVVLFINGKANHEKHTVLSRPDVEKFSHTLTDPGYDALVPIADALGPETEFRAFAISHYGYASELRYQEQYDDGCSSQVLGPNSPAPTVAP